jgi:hypothetical protein
LQEISQGIDFALEVFTRASSADTNATITDIKLPEIYRDALSWLIADAAFFQGDSGPEIGKEISWSNYDKETGDACNLVFKMSEVQTNLEAVTARIQDFQHTRLETIIFQAIRGRSHAMDIVKIQHNCLQWVDTHLDTFREPGPPWSKVGFISICVLLRACAKSLFEAFPSNEERETQLNSWKERISAFVYIDKAPNQDFPYNRDGDFVIKAHTAVSSYEALFLKI